MAMKLLRLILKTNDGIQLIIVIADRYLKLIREMKLVKPTATQILKELLERWIVLDSVTSNRRVLQYLNVLEKSSYL